MSVDIDWAKITGGPSGAALAAKIRDFIDDRFQTMALPRFIKSVKVHDFDFGTISPEVEIKDVTDPLPDFYEENPEADDADADDDVEEPEEELISPAEKRRRERTEAGAPLPTPGGGVVGLGREGEEESIMMSPTPGVPGGTSNMHYFHLHPHHHWSGAQTPLAAVTGVTGHAHPNPFNAVNSPGHHVPQHLQSQNQYQQQFQPHPGRLPHHQNTPPPTPLAHPTPISIPRRRLGHSRQASHSSVASGDVVNSPSLVPPFLNTKGSVSTFAPPSSAGGSTRPPTRDALREALGGSTLAAESSHPAVSSGSISAGSEAVAEEDEEDHRPPEPRVEDTQAVFRIKYAGDIHLALTAELLLDYPMPAFVGIPVRLNITGLSFDGVGVVAKIRRRAHFCFLSPEDAQAYAETPDQQGENGEEHEKETGPIGGLLKEVKVESEIGQNGDGGRQTLRNVGKVERFVLEKVRSIFEDELVYPSYWTFLI
ncbi:uncharacterized protein MKZ38_010424 [Zalerion maritima]|uniref:Mitochondrial distribution and morphology protein 12 n=1 Tax=Zalerion maritima TaxID=339359 RepID=A0AAD5RSG2_9PEZI|nr:uncharacterized protein MKZ38_010424 [Zalerion maritima]